MSPTFGQQTVNQVFDFTGAMETFIVPDGVTEVHIQAYGAEGGMAVGTSGCAGSAEIGH